MQRTVVPNRIAPSARAALGSKETEPALKVATVYQDPLTRHWAAELWDRVGQLVGGAGMCRNSWKLGQLTEPRVFAAAVRAANEADVLIISVRDTPELPAALCLWIDAWLPARSGRVGALVALIGVPARPDAQFGRAHEYLKMVAGQAGLDFLPRERKLPEGSSALPGLAGITRVADRTMPCFGAASL